jgi:hypothetical protein
MPDIPSSAAVSSPPAPSNNLADLVGDLWNYQQLAAALGCSERSVYNLMEQMRVPYVRVLGKRLVNPADFRAALARQQANTSSRGRGRPRKAA